MIRQPTRAASSCECIPHQNVVELQLIRSLLGRLLVVNMWRVHLEDRCLDLTRQATCRPYLPDGQYL